MRQIIPFTKELPFKTSLCEITSISLEHTINNKDSEIVSGIFHVSGEYKVTEIAVTREVFEFDIPFDIEISNYDINTILVDIDNFYYEIINNDTLKVNIDLFIEGEEIKKEIPKESTREEEIIIKEEQEIEIPPTKEENNLENPSVEFNGINTITNTTFEEEYITYYVYIVKEGDTIDTITTKYNTNRETISIYNDIENIKKGDKLIIPSNK